MEPKDYLRKKQIRNVQSDREADVKGSIAYFEELKRNKQASMEHYDALKQLVNKHNDLLKVGKGKSRRRRHKRRHTRRS